MMIRSDFIKMKRSDDYHLVELLQSTRVHGFRNVLNVEPVFAATASMGK